MKRTGNSANITFYRRRDGVWCEVLRNDYERRDGVLQPKRVPTFNITVYRPGEGEIARTRYAPKRKPASYELPGRTVARLVAEALPAPARPERCTVCGGLNPGDITHTRCAS